MKSYLLLFAILLLSSVLLPAQKNYRAIDKRAVEAPNAEKASITRLAAYLTASAKDDYEKARAIYSWITHHVAYSDSTVSNGWLGTSENKLNQQAENVLKNSSAVCEGFANLYKALCTAADLKAEIVTGVVKQENGEVSDFGHAWNAVQLAGQWYLTDPTWGAGYADYWTGRFVQEYQEAYFLMPAEKMIQNHLPDDPIWQLLANPVTEQEFRDLSKEALYLKATEKTAYPFVYQDSIQAWFQQDSIQQMLGASERILRYNPQSSVALARLGNHFYNQAVTIFFYGEEEILKSLDDTQRALDTARLLRQFINAEQLLQKGWFYYKQVEDSKLNSMIAGLAPEPVLGAEFNYLRGLMQVWQVAQLYHQLLNSSKNMPEDFYQYLNITAKQAQTYFNAAAVVYPRYNGELYQDALNKVKLHEALLYNYVAKAEGTLITLEDSFSEAMLQSLAKRLDQGETLYHKMLNIVNEVIAADATSLLAMSFLEEKPLMLAGFEADRGFIQQYMVRKKYEQQWENPSLMTKTIKNEVTEALLQCETNVKKGLEELEDIGAPKEGVEQLTRRLHTLRSNTYVQIADVERRYLIGALQKIKTTQAFKPQQAGFLKSCDNIVANYNQALKWVNENKDLKRYLQKSITEVKELRNKLEHY